MKKITYIFIFSMLLVSCRHKDLQYEETETATTEIVFDWSLAPDADPASMSAFLFPDDSRPLRYEFANSEGGEVRIPLGHYCGLAMNSDDTDWARFRDTDDIEKFEIHTAPVESLPVSGLTPDMLPLEDEEEYEDLVKAPGMLWSTRRDNLTLTESDRKKTFVFYPQEAVCHYTVDIYDVKNMKSLPGNDIDATLSGMAGGFLHGQGTSSDSKVTFPIILTADKEKNSLHSEFLTFGENPVKDLPHRLKIHATLADGSILHQTFDVGNQIKNATDPKHVHIVIRGFTLPEEEVTTGGFRPDVNEWHNENIDLDM